VLFAREGAKVFAIDLRPEAVQETKEIIEQEGGVCASFAADVSDSSQVQAVVAECAKTFDRIDVLHNNVGILAVGGPIDYATGGDGPARSAIHG
jgi:NAD(P)-dependent dehydrogenase (short-subunit alcohol dehydrogenase family)